MVASPFSGKADAPFYRGAGQTSSCPTKLQPQENPEVSVRSQRQQSKPLWKGWAICQDHDTNPVVFLLPFYFLLLCFYDVLWLFHMAFAGWTPAGLTLFPGPRPRSGGRSWILASLSWVLASWSGFCPLERGTAYGDLISVWFPLASVELFPFHEQGSTDSILFVLPPVFQARAFIFHPFLMKEWQKRNSGMERAKLLSKSKEMAQQRIFPSKGSFPQTQPRPLSLNHLFLERCQDEQFQIIAENQLLGCPKQLWIWPPERRPWQQKPSKRRKTSPVSSCTKALKQRHNLSYKSIFQVYK